jgi:hypothetical protein
MWYRGEVLRGVVGMPLYDEDRRRRRRGERGEEKRDMSLISWNKLSF